MADEYSQARQTTHELPTELRGGDLSGVLLAYQKRLLEATATQQVVVCEKSRRIGATWGIAADAVLTAGARKSAGGMDVFYIGYNLDMTREFIDTCAMWARAFVPAASDVGEFLFTEQDERGADRTIQAFRIRFASGFEIVALCSRPRSLRGRQGYVIIDEAAFHDELDELLKAALALLIWGGKVLVISTHDSVDNPFNELCEEIRAGRRPYGLLRVTFDDALSDGLYQRVCLVRGKVWSSEAETTWRDEIRGFYGEAAEEELDCIPRKSAGKYLARSLLEARMVDVPVVRWELPNEFVDVPEERRIADCDAFCREKLLPTLRLIPHCPTFVGEDFGRVVDLSVFWALSLEQDLRRLTRIVVELRNVPFKQQEQVLFFLCDNLPRFSGAALDSTGNGRYLAEVARQKYGPTLVVEVTLTEGWYGEHFPRFRANLEDDKFSLPRDRDILDDLRTVVVVRGVPRVVARTGGQGAKRHGDSAIAACLANFASGALEGSRPEFMSAGPAEALGAFDGTDLGSGFEGWM
jgi:phage FluMu gp28-like protein